MAWSNEKRIEGAAEAVAEKGEGIDGFVLASFQHRRDDGLGVAAGAGAVAAPDFAIDDWRLQGLLGPMIRGRNRRVNEKQEPSGGMIVQMLGEASVGLVRTWPLRQLAETIDKVLVSVATAV